MQGRSVRWFGRVCGSVAERLARKEPHGKSSGGIFSRQRSVRHSGTDACAQLRELGSFQAITVVGGEGELAPVKRAPHWRSVDTGAARRGYVARELGRRYGSSDRAARRRGGALRRFVLGRGWPSNAWWRWHHAQRGVLCGRAVRELRSGDRGEDKGEMGWAKKAVG